MALEQTVKDLQTQNAQLQQMIMALAKGNEELKALIVKDKSEGFKDQTKRNGTAKYVYGFERGL